MKNYFSVLKLLLVNMFRRGDKKSNYMMVAYASILIIALIVSFSVAMGLYVSAPYFEDINNLITSLLVVTFFLVIILSVVSMLAHLYFAKDAEFFLALPIKPSVIYFAKLSMVYLVELVVVLLAMIPSMLMIGLSLSLGAVYYITMILAVLIVPLFPLVFTSVLSLPIMYLVSYLKNKGAAASIVIILLFGGVMTAYMMFSFSINSGAVDSVDTSLAETIAAYEQGIKPWLKIFAPFLALSRFATMTDTYGSTALSMLINISIFLGSALVLFLLALFISNKAYTRGVAKNLETSTVTSSKGKDVKRSTVKSLMLMEWNEIFRNPSFALQCLAGIILSPIMVFVVLFMIGKIDDGMAEIADYTWLISSAILIFFVVSLNISAQTAITRMGSAFYYTKIIPVDYTVQIRAKLMLYNLISLSSIVLGTIVTLPFVSSWWVAPVMICALMVIGYAFNAFSIWFDLRNPKLDWVTYNEAVKHNKNVVANTLINMGIAFVLLAIFGIIFSVNVFLLGHAGTIVSFIVLGLIALIPAAIFHKILYKNLDYKFFCLP